MPLLPLSPDERADKLSGAMMADIVGSILPAARPPAVSIIHWDQR